MVINRLGSSEHKIIYKFTKVMRKNSKYGYNKVQKLIQL